MDNQTQDAPFAPDLSVIDIAAWLRIREDDWESLVAFDQDENLFLEEDAA